jgi:redox-sensitive bicupin YhaK (pirin superfamily)
MGVWFGRTQVELAAGGGASVLLLRGRPLGEPIAHYGPFVMNTFQEIRQAVADYEAGRLASPPASVA